MYRTVISIPPHGQGCQIGAIFPAQSGGCAAARVARLGGKSDPNLATLPFPTGVFRQKVENTYFLEVAPNGSGSPSIAFLLGIDLHLLIS